MESSKSDRRETELLDFSPIYFPNFQDYKKTLPRRKKQRIKDECCGFSRTSWIFLILALLQGQTSTLNTQNLTPFIKYIVMFSLLKLVHQLIGQRIILCCTATPFGKIGRVWSTACTIFILSSRIWRSILSLYFLWDVCGIIKLALCNALLISFWNCMLAHRFCAMR